MTSFTMVGIDNCLEAQDEMVLSGASKPKGLDVHFCGFFLRNALSHLHLYCAIIKFRVYLDIKYKYREFSSLLAIA